MTSEYKSLLEEFYGNQDSKPGPETPEDRQRRWSREAMRRLYAKRRKLGLNAHGKPFAIRRRRKYVDRTIQRSIL